ncbi:MAG TPA: hypothetical protein VHD58_06290 [Mycobacteriales bacterium]|nr:hypothetical protein [Mycobacteriales bacterium]
MSDSQWQHERQAAEALTQRILREQQQGQEPIIHQEDLALLNQRQLNTINHGPYGVQR